MFIVDAAKNIDESVVHIMHQLETNMDDVRRMLKISAEGASKKDFILVLNKVFNSARNLYNLIFLQTDLVKPRDRMLPLIAKLNESKLFTDTFLISALKGHETDELKVYLFCSPA